MTMPAQVLSEPASVPEVPQEPQSEPELVLIPLQAQERQLAPAQLGQHQQVVLMPVVTSEQVKARPRELAQAFKENIATKDESGDHFS